MIVRVAALLLALLLAGCAAVPPAGTITSAPEQWQLVGRLALSNGRDGGSGRLEWSHGSDRDELRFHGALGRGSWRLSSDADAAVLRLADGGIIRAPDTTSLVRDELGWDIPVRELSAWVVGKPSPVGAFATQRDGSGQLELLQQAGWTIRFEGYGEHGGRWVPRKVTAERGGDRVRLIVSEWRFDDGEQRVRAN